MTHPPPATTPATPDTPLPITALVGRALVTANNRQIGHIVDVEVSRSQGFRVTALLFGRYGWLDRLRVLHPVVRQLGIPVKPHRVPWHAVARIERRRVVLNRNLLPKR